MRSTDALARRAVIIGVAAHVPPRGGPAEGFWTTAARVAKLACDEAKLTASDIDGVMFAQSGYAGLNAPYPTTFAQVMGIAPAWMEAIPHGGQQILSALWRARTAIEHGMARRVLVVACDNRSERLQRDGVVARIAQQNMDGEFEVPYGCTFPSAMALMARRHMIHYGTTEEQMALVRVHSSTWAGMHPDAFLRNAVSVEDVMASKRIASPLKLLDMCLVTDGAAALVISDADDAAANGIDGAHIAGVGDCGESQFVSGLPDADEITMLERAAGLAMAEAELDVGDVDVFYPYDPSTFHVIWAAEQLGLCARGEGGQYVASGAIAPGGSTPFNTHGGLLGFCHPGLPGGLFGVVEAVRQLRGEAARRQVPGAGVALVTAMGGYMTTGAAVLVGPR